MLQRFQLSVIAFVLLLGALSTGAAYLWFLVYLGALVIGGAWLVTRLGLSALEAGSTPDRAHARVGETLNVTYTVRNRSRLPKLWLEVHSPSTLPVAIPGRAVALGPRSERSWTARVPLTRRGHYRIDPMVVRTGDPLGLFESYASVGVGAGVIVYPAVDPLPRWKLPAAVIEGSNAHPERTFQATPLVTSIRPYVTGDAFNRIHWKSSARQQELQVKEFDLDQTADVWLFLDLQRAVSTGVDDEATIETAVRTCASIASRALAERRAVGLEVAGTRRVVLPMDRGARQHQKLMQLLAAVQPDGAVPIRELLVDGVARLRRGMTAVVVTSSLDRDWVRPLAELRTRGVAVVACVVDPLAHEERTRAVRAEPALLPDEREAWSRDLWALRHALAEHELRAYVLEPGTALGDQIVSGAARSGAAAR